MAKAKKKRTKKYTGADAATTRPSITRVHAIQRSPIHQWLHDHRRIVKIGGAAIGIIAILILVISGIISLF